MVKEIIQKARNIAKRMTPSDQKAMLEICTELEEAENAREENLPTIVGAIIELSKLLPPRDNAPDTIGLTIIHNDHRFTAFFKKSEYIGNGWEFIGYDTTKIL